MTREELISRFRYWWAATKLWVTLHVYVIELLERIVALENEVKQQQLTNRNIVATLLNDRENFINERHAAKSDGNSVPTRHSDTEETPPVTRRRANRDTPERG